MSNINTQKYNLFLDDFRIPHDAFMVTYNTLYNMLDWVIVRNYDEFVECITNNPNVNVISLDHDLADVHYDDTFPDYDRYTEKTGYDCVKWLCEFYTDKPNMFPECFIHSANVVGSENMRQYIKNFKKHNNI